MSNDNTQVVMAYEKSRLSVEEIADSLGMELLAVKTILCLESSQYRKDTKEDVTDDELNEMFSVVKDIACSTLTRVQQPGVALKAATFLINEKKGRNDPRNLLKSLTGSGISITLINQRVEGMKQAKARTLSMTPQKTIELVPA
jgi:hypothetical protein